MAGRVEANYNATYVAPSTINEPQIRRTIFPRYNERTLPNFLIHSGRKEKVGNTKFEWPEMDFLRSYVEVESKAGSAGAGNAVTVTVKDANHQDSGKLSPIKKKDQILIYTASGPIQAWVTAVDKSVDNTHTFTAKPIDDTVDLVTAVAANNFVTVLSNAKGDGTGQNTSMARKPLTFFNYTQIFSTQYLTNGSESANRSYFDIKGKPYYYLQGVEDAENDHMLSMEYAFILGQRGTKVDPDNSETVYFTGGMDYHIDTYGIDEPYTTTFGLTDLQNMAKALDAERASAEHLFLVGTNLNMDIDNFAKGVLDNTAIDYSKWGNGNANLRQIDLGFDAFRYGNFTFHKFKFDALNYKPVTGITNSPYPNTGYTIPMDKVKNTSGSGPEYLDTISLVYKGNDKGDRFMQSWERNVKITNNDQLEFNHLSEAGLRFIGANSAIKVTKS